MTINLSIPLQESLSLSPRITIIGVGGAGGNAVNNMIESRLEGVDFVVANTDAQAITQSLAEQRIQLGTNITHGLGAGARPDIGRAAAEEAIDELVAQMQGVHMVFITAGMGGGTGTGAGPVIARLAREHGILTVGVVTKPFQFEGINRMRIAEAGIEEMQQFVDTLIVIPNQNLFRVANERTTFAEAFSMADQVLHSGVRGVTDLMVVPGLINLDFADIRTVMSEMGKAMMGTGEADGEDRARLAAEAAISNPLLDEVSMKGARGVLINITGGQDMTLFEVDEAANRIGDEVDSEANIIFGSTMDPQMEGRIRVSVVATGIDAEAAAAHPRPVLKLYSRSSKEEATEAEEVDWRGDPVPAPVAAPAAETAIVEEEAAPAAAHEMGAQPAMREATLEPAAAPTLPEMGLPEPAPAPADLTAASHATPNAGENAFIPPRPVDPNGRQEAGPDPFRAADLINGGGPPKERKRAPNLIQRMTSNVRLKASAQETPQPEMLSPPALTASGVAATASLEERQPRLDAAAAQERFTVSQSEEDLLDIPAFLRRQAN